MYSINYNKVSFVLSAADKKQFIHDSRRRAVFAGKSNVGKSSVINRLLNRKNFARVGSEPGKTVHVNYFLVDDRLYLIDLPGYGYAKVSAAEKMRWSALMEAFFAEEEIDAAVLIVDARHLPTKDDKMMADWMMSSGCRFAVVANKIDKLKKSQIDGCISGIREALSLEAEVPLIAFSAEKGDGREELMTFIGESV
ncbi:MAG: YihA family ribosome biogenesis GTP-binding protein [Oscillospiraceae bacterium]|nr:YihA family ribosome biogenesis GTP-binding protein [Oscillospiraceae bacterium]